MKIAVAGLGYVGLTNAVWLAQKNEVYAVDVDVARVAMVNGRTSPIVDVELEEFLACQENFAMDVDWQNCIMVDDKITDIIALESMGIINNYLLVSEKNCDAAHRVRDISCAFNKIL